MEWHHLIDNDGYSRSQQFARAESDIGDAIEAIHWPIDADEFILNPVPKGNGVKPIKDGFVTLLTSRGWEHEIRPRLFDAQLTFGGDAKPFGAEWETGNVSSSHRAINRLLLASYQGAFVGGVLIVPSRKTYRYLTDRIGNASELEPYYPLWRSYGQTNACTYLGIVVVEHDALDPSVPLIGKGTDGRALI